MRNTVTCSEVYEVQMKKNRKEKKHKECYNVMSHLMPSPHILGHQLLSMCSLTLCVLVEFGSQAALWLQHESCGSSIPLSSGPSKPGWPLEHSIAASLPLTRGHFRLSSRQTLCSVDYVQRPECSAAAPTTASGGNRYCS